VRFNLLFVAEATPTNRVNDLSYKRGAYVRENLGSAQVITANTAMTCCFIGQFSDDVQQKWP